MFGIPQMMTIPAITTVGAMAVDWPTVGAFLAWTLIAALVGTGLGALRRMTSPPPSVTQTLATRITPSRAHVGVDYNHLEAA